VSGVGDSNPLVLTKKPQKNQPIKAGFFMSEIFLGNERGVMGEKLPTNDGEYAQMIGKSSHLPV